MSTTIFPPPAPAPLALPAPPSRATSAARSGARRAGALPRALRGAGWLATLALGALTVGIAATAALPAVGAHLLVVTSGSMAPAIAAGDAVVAVDTAADGIAVGDVIAFQGYGSDRLTTHRVISRHDVSGRQHFRTRGDANATPDANLAPAEGVAGKVVLTLPGAGRPLLALTHPWARLLLLAGPAAVLAGLELRDLLADRTAPRQPPRRAWSIPCPATGR